MLEKYGKCLPPVGAIYPSHNLTGSQVKRIPARARKGLAAKVAETEMPVKVLAHKAGCSERTVRNFLNGKVVRNDTLKQICKASGVDLDSTPKKSSSTLGSDQMHGSYSKELVQDYIGYFYAYRRSFFEDNVFIKSLYLFDWNESSRCLRFTESQNYQSKRLQRRVCYDQDGDVFISNSIGAVHLLTVTAGALRLITLTKLHPEEFVMRGAVLTQAEWPDHYQPAASPIYFRKIAAIDADASVLMRGLGPVDPGDPDHEHIRQSLDFAQNDVVNFRCPSP